MAKKVSLAYVVSALRGTGMKFTGDFHKECNSSDQNFLAHNAKLYGYKKPANATGSTARYFYEYICKKIKAGKV